MQVPHFDRRDSFAWIFKINKFFNFHQAHEDQRINIAIYYMEWTTLSWFQWMYKSGQIVSWNNLLPALQIRVAPSQFEDQDPQGSLFKLTQTSIVREYHTQFQILSNQVCGLPPHFFSIALFQD